MNCINLIGNLGRDPEIKYLEGGKAVTKFSIAVQRRFNRDKSDWFNCEVWGKSAQAAVDYLKKGSKVAVTGEINFEAYTKDGQERMSAVVKVDSFDFLTPKPQDSQPQGQGNANVYDF